MASLVTSILLTLPAVWASCEAESATQGRALLQLGRQAATAQSVIDKHFAHVPSGGGSLRTNLVLTQQASFECSQIDFSSFVGYENDKVKQLMEELQLTTFCGEVEGGGLTPEDPTCLAFWAGLKAHLELQESYEPVSFHYMLVNWMQHNPGQFASWGSEPTVNVTYTPGMVPNWTIEEPNVVSGYAFCDIVVTVLRQNADQAGSGTCGPTVWLAALNILNPAGSIKKGLELYWTGTMPEIAAADRPCDYVYNNIPPGLLPYQPNQPGYGTQGSSICTGNPTDCQQAAHKPAMQAGFQGMWAMEMSSAADRHWASCDEQYWRTPSLAANHELLEQYTTTWDQLFFCHISFGKDCRYVTHNKVCDQLPADLQAKCYDLLTMDGLTVLDVVALKEFAGVSDGPPKVSAEWAWFYNHTMAPGGRGAAFAEKLHALGLAPMNAMSSVMPEGSLSKAEIGELCNSENGAAFFIVAEVLQSENPAEPWSVPGTPGICDHFVYCDSAENDVASIWTWGTRYYNTLGSLENTICGGIPIP